MFRSISIDEYVKWYIQSNPGESAADFRASLAKEVERKRNGDLCFCGQPIWAIGSAIAGTGMCFTCTTGKKDDSEDYEIENVCF